MTTEPSILVIDDEPQILRAMKTILSQKGYKVQTANRGEDGLTLAAAAPPDVVILDLGLPDMTGFELIEQIKQQANLAKLPIIVYTGKELTREEETQLKRLSETIIVKDVRSPERLLDETALFLHRV